MSTSATPMNIDMTVNKTVETTVNDMFKGDPPQRAWNAKRVLNEHQNKQKLAEQRQQKVVDIPFGFMPSTGKPRPEGFSLEQGLKRIEQSLAKNLRNGQNDIKNEIISFIRTDVIKPITDKAAERHNFLCQRLSALEKKLNTNVQANKPPPFKPTFTKNDLTMLWDNLCAEVQTKVITTDEKGNPASLPCGNPNCTVNPTRSLESAYLREQIEKYGLPQTCLRCFGFWAHKECLEPARREHDRKIKGNYCDIHPELNILKSADKQFPNILKAREHKAHAKKKQQAQQKKKNRQASSSSTPNAKKHKQNPVLVE